MKTRLWFTLWFVLTGSSLLLINGYTIISGAQNIIDVPTTTPTVTRNIVEMTMLLDGIVRQFDCIEATPWSEPTQESGDLPTSTPTPSPTPIPRCYGLVIATSLNVRSGPGTAYSVSTTLKIMAQVDILSAVVNAGGETWYRITSPAGYVLSTYVTIPTDAACNLAAMSAAPVNKFGLHLTVGASQDVVYAALPRVGLLKGTSGTENIIIGARKLRPDLLILYRVIAPDCPPGWGQGDAPTVADSWWSAKYSQWKAAGMIGIADFYELTNECGYGGSAFERAFWGRMIEHANAAGVCLALFSDSYGTPTTLEFQFRAPILDLALAQECKPGKRHIIAMHSYEGVNSGDWKFGRWRLFMSTMAAKYKAVPIVFTEYAYNSGSGKVDCGALWTDWARAEREYSADPQVLGALYFNASPVGGWMDISSCLI
jgi:hypothetical protein